MSFKKTALAYLEYFKGPFSKKTGHDRTVRKFISYVRNLVILDATALVIYLSFPGYQAAAYIFALIFITGLFGIYSFLSLRMRKIEEVYECQDRKEKKN